MKRPAPKRQPVQKRPPPEDRRERFVSEYLVDLNASRAYQRVYGGTNGTARTNGSRLLAKADIADLVAKGKAAQLKRADLSAARVLEELRRMAFVDATTVLACRSVDDLLALPEETRAAILGFEVLESNIPGLKDGKTDTVRRVRFASKLHALEMLAKHFKLLTDVIEADNMDDLLERLDRGRERNAKRKDRE